MGDETEAGQHFQASMRLANGATVSVSAVGAEVVTKRHNESADDLVPFRMTEDEADEFATLMRMASRCAGRARQIEGRNH